MPAASTLNDDFPVSFPVFAAKLAGTDEEIWTKLLKAAHGKKKMSELAWGKLLDSIKKG
jgi:hypothetical protein